MLTQVNLPAALFLGAHHVFVLPGPVQGITGRKIHLLCDRRPGGFYIVSQLNAFDIDEYPAVQPGVLTLGHRWAIFHPEVGHGG